MFEINTDVKFKSPWEDAKLTGDIMVVPGVLPSGLCNWMIERAELLKECWHRSFTVGEAKGGMTKIEGSPRQSDSFFISKHAQTIPSLKADDEILFHTFSRGLQTYTRLVGQDVAVNDDEGYTMLRYGPGDYYSYHTDNGGIRGNTLRTMSSLIYLNDNYEGGELDFPRQNVKIKPTAGMLVMFPAILTFPHASLPIKSGTKYTVVTWFR